MVLELDIYIQNKKISRHRPYTLHKHQLKWTIGLNVRHRTVKLIEDNIGENLELDYGSDFLDINNKGTIHE